VIPCAALDKNMVRQEDVRMGVSKEEEGLRRTVRSMVLALIPEVEGKPVVNVSAIQDHVHVCRRISGLHINEEEEFIAQGCDWVDPEEARPAELGDGMLIHLELVRVGRGYWYDGYFHWYFVYDPELVARSVAGDHAWVQSFLDAR
jgi:hypothetical protein